MHSFPGADAVLPAVGDVVERTTPTASPSSPLAAAAHLRPIQAVVGQAFPAVRARRAYGRQRSDVGAPPASTRAQAAAAVFSAHVQPHDATSRPADVHGAGASRATAGGVQSRVPEGGTEVVLAAGGSVQQRLPAHQWTADEFHQLRSGYYTQPVDDDTVASGGTPTAPSPARVSGEAFFALLFQCLRSTVRKHQQLALEVLLAHLVGLTMPGPTSGAAASVVDARRAEAVALRDRCRHGPNCAPLLFFVLEMLISAGHPAMVELAATCLLLLLRGMTRGEPAAAAAAAGSASTTEAVYGAFGGAVLLVEAIAELGSPAADAPEEDGAEGSRGARADAGVGAVAGETVPDDPDLPFSEVSELLRGPDARLGLEQLGFTNKVLAAMPLLLLPPPPQRTGDGTTAMAAAGDAAAAAAVVGGADGGEGDGQKGRDDSSAVAGSPAVVPAEVLFAELLLCGGVGVGRRITCRRVAEDPAFLSWAEAQLSEVVLGHRRLEDVAELLCVLRHLSHDAQALHSLLRGGAASTAATHGGSLVTAAAPRGVQHRFYETWLLFFLLVCSTEAAEVRTVRHVSVIVWSMLLLRACVRLPRDSSGGATGEAGAAAHGGYGLVQDVSDTLLREGMGVGAAAVLEMWFLQHTSDDVRVGVDSGGGGDGAGQSALESYFMDAARTALRLCHTPAGSVAGTAAPAHSAVVASSSGGVSGGLADGSLSELAAARLLLSELRWTTSAHFLSTFVVRMRRRSPAACYTLGGAAVETQSAMQRLLRSVVMDATRLSRSFARFTSPLLTPATSAPPPHGAAASAVAAVARRWLGEAAGEAEQVAPRSAASLGHAARDTALLHLAFEAASLYANTRLAAALAEVYPAVAGDVVLGYAAMLVHAFEAACLRLRDGAAVRIQMDELCAMTEAVQLLQRLGDGARRPSDAAGAPLAPPPHHMREARTGAFFLLHSIALSKHCLDVVPALLPLLLLPLQPPRHRAGAGEAVGEAECVALVESLQQGIELTPVPAVLHRGSDSAAAAVAVSGAPRSWALYPLYDAGFTATQLWARWLRHLLGLHQRVKDVLGWDALLCHTLLWTLAHRRQLWEGGGGAHSRDGGALGGAAALPSAPLEPSSATALCELMVDLCALLHVPSADPRDASSVAGALVSAPASRALEIALTAYSDVPSEDGLPLLMHALLALVAAHSSARAALAALHVLLASPVLLSPPPPPPRAQECAAAAAPPSSQCSDGVLASSTERVCGWLQAWARSPMHATRLAAAWVPWGLEDVVALVQLVGPHLRDNFVGDGVGGAREEEQGVAGFATPVMTAAQEDPAWCVRCVVDGVLRRYAAGRRRSGGAGGFSAMEQVVLRTTLEDLDWYPAALWPHLEEEGEGEKVA